MNQQWFALIHAVPVYHSVLLGIQAAPDGLGKIGMGRQNQNGLHTNSNSQPTDNSFQADAVTEIHHPLSSWQGQLNPAAEFVF
jgi:hypothetical protein